MTQLVVATVAGGLFGQWSDARFDTAPALMVTGFVLGFAAGLVGLFRILPSPDEDDDDL
ncbi:MAG: AtpZ/AtpI family protein [Myxococcota bacterium]